MNLDKEPSSKGLSWVLSIAGAVVTASIQEDLSGLLVGAALGFLLAQVLHLRGWVRELHRQLRGDGAFADETHPPAGLSWLSTSNRCSPERPEALRAPSHIFARALRLSLIRLTPNA